MKGYYTVFFNGEKIACFFQGADLVDYIERSVYAGCTLSGWSVRFPDGKFRDVVVDVKVHF